MAVDGFAGVLNVLTEHVSVVKDHTNIASRCDGYNGSRTNVDAIEWGRCTVEL
jgi:hypothetical protein